MCIQLVPQHAGRDDGIFRVLPPQRLEFVVSGLIDDKVFFDPARPAVRRLHLEKATLVIEDLQLLAIADRSDLGRHRRDPVTQPCLLGHDIHHIRRIRRSVMAPGWKREGPRYGNARSERKNAPAP